MFTLDKGTRHKLLAHLAILLKIEVTTSEIIGYRVPLLNDEQGECIRTKLWTMPVPAETLRAHAYFKIISRCV